MLFYNSPHVAAKKWRKYIDSNQAWSLDVFAGDFKEVYPSSLEKGTKVSIKNLFFATPARLKFLKSSQVEKSYCHQIILKMALVNPFVGFNFKADGRELLNIRPEIISNGVSLATHREERGEQSR